MPEQQNIEYKQSWHDDYLKWVCGFANAQGGVIYTPSLRIYLTLNKCTKGAGWSVEFAIPLFVL